jgi:hypothetical protein
MAQIQKFAAETPFSVQELTASFVKLANQGFRPTEIQMRQLGDVAASTGKSFDQLTEAIIDAQVGEFERLKEFGIRAQKEGDQVKFTFKGVQTQVQFTSDSIREYVTSLGDAVGVSGSMEAISKTLGGQISNLGDSWDQLLLTLGGQTEGVFSTAISALNELIAGLTSFAKTDQQWQQESQQNREAGIIALFDAYAKGFKDVNRAAELHIQTLEREAAAAQEVYDLAIKQSKFDGSKEELESLNTKEKKVELLKEEIVIIQDYVKKLNEEKKIKEDKAADDAKAKRIADEAKAYKKAKEELDRLAKLEQERRDNLDKNIAKNPVSGRAVAGVKPTDLTDPIKEIQDRAAKEIIATAEANKAKEKQEEEHQQRIKDIKMQAVDAALNIFQMLALANDNSIQKQISAEQDKENNLLTLAGDNQRAKDQIKIDSDKRIAALNAQQAKQEKKDAVKKILIQGLVAIAKTFAELGWPLGIVPAALSAAQTAVLAGTVGKYKEGGWIKGPGSETSDSVPILASKNEYMVKASAARMSPQLLDAINDRRIDDSILQKLRVTPNGVVATLDDKNIVNAINSNKGSLSREGYTLYETIETGNGFKRKIRSKILSR